MVARFFFPGSIVDRERRHAADRLLPNGVWEFVPTAVRGGTTDASTDGLFTVMPTSPTFETEQGLVVAGFVSWRCSSSMRPGCLRR